jgi:L-aminoadipate-semialdehyde dehydrogenase
MATLTAIELASTNKQKLLVFVSSTSVLDTAYYVQASHSASYGGYNGVPESDELAGSTIGLGNGYGQTKWVSEKLLFEAGKRGRRSHIVRPGYVVGDSRSGRM